MTPTTSEPVAVAAPVPAAVAKPGGFRWAICGLLFFSVAINYVDRNIIGILKGPLSQDLGWSETDYAHIAAAFQFAYAFGYLFGGRLMDRLGVKRGLPLAVGVWSVAAAAHGACSLLPHGQVVTVSLAWLSLGAMVVPLTAMGFIAARVALGLAEGGNFPGAIKTVAEWFPVRERALATGIFNAGTNIGAILCPFAVPRMYAAWGWPSTFYVTGALGVLWILAWRRLYDNPAQHRRLSPAERAYICSDQPAPAEAEPPVPWLSLFSYRAVWAYLAASVLAGPVWNIYMFFLPDFLQKRYQLPLVQVGDWTAVFYFIASFGGIAGGWLFGRLLGRGWTVNAARKSTMLCCALAVLPIYFAPLAPTIWLTVAIVGLAGSAHQGWSANQFSFVADTMPRRAISSVVGLGGFVAYFTGGFMTEAIGLILKKTGSYESIFMAASVMYVAALSVMQLLVPRIGAQPPAARTAGSTPREGGRAPARGGAIAPWQPDRGDGTYQNPVLFADYSDPDVVRVGEDYWLIASSFNHVPGLPILHSRDLVNWTLMNHALPRLVPAGHFSVPRHGGGVWAPTIRHHAGRYWIYYPDPDFGIYAVTAGHPSERWSEPRLVMGGRGLIDPCPFWDEDGLGYLIHGWAKSRSGIKNRLTLHRLGPDNFSVTGAGVDVVDGDRMDGWTTIEGPKLYKRAGYYYIFAPAGGVRDGYQAVFRSRQIGGPYENRVVLAQGATAVNGPHQGAWVDTPAGEDWFLHFQELPVYGRVVHLQPLQWKDGWPEVGQAVNGHGSGEPVPTHRKPRAAGARRSAPATSDEFPGGVIGPQWQWQANPQPAWTAAPGAGPLRLNCTPHEDSRTLWVAPNLLLQKFPGPEFEVTTRFRFSPAQDGDVAGLIIFGHDYAWIGLRRKSGRLALTRSQCLAANEGGGEEEICSREITSGEMHLRVSVKKGGSCQFAFSGDGEEFTLLGPPFQAVSSSWVGAKVGLFAAARGPSQGPAGHVNVDWVRLA